MGHHVVQVSGDARLLLEDRAAGPFELVLLLLAHQCPARKHQPPDQQGEQHHRRQRDGPAPRRVGERLALARHGRAEQQRGRAPRDGDDLHRRPQSHGEQQRDQRDHLHHLERQIVVRLMRDGQRDEQRRAGGDGPAQRRVDPHEQDRERGERGDERLCPRRHGVRQVQRRPRDRVEDQRGQHDGHVEPATRVQPLRQVTGLLLHGYDPRNPGPARASYPRVNSYPVLRGEPTRPIPRQHGGANPTSAGGR
ncbi:hypothetical protein APR12_002437 [Nocardia amikacinitolerans]|nr:hypothetical protein [Nocardia amikacinitolerans]